MNQAFSIKCAQLEDAKALSQLESAVQKYPWSQQKIIDSIKAHKVFCVRNKKDDSIKGFAVLMPLLDEAELLNIAAIAPHQGYGSLLWHAILAYCHHNQIGRIYLEVAHANLKARQVYQHWGFSEVGRRTKYYRCLRDNSYDDAIVMHYNLKVKVAQQ